MMHPTSVASSRLLPPTRTDGIEVRLLPNRGATAFATRDFEVGDVVLCEEPIVVISAGKESSFNDPGVKPFLAFVRDHYGVGSGGGEAFGFWSTLRPLSLLPRSVLEHLRSVLYSPLVMRIRTEGNTTNEVPSDSLAMSMTSSEVRACEALFVGKNGYHFNACFGSLAELGDDCCSYNFLLEIRKTMEAPSASDSDGSEKIAAIYNVLKLLHGCRINDHSHEATGITCIFPLCMKLSHSCHPNTFWKMTAVEEGGEDAVRARWEGTQQCNNRRDIRAVHIAERLIKQGEELSFSYVGTGLNMLCDTSRRRDSLHPLGFICRCDRCAAYDKDAESCRSLMCLLCRKRGAVRLSPSDSSWRCSFCSEGVLPAENFADAGALLEAETVLEKVVMAVMFKSKGNPADDPLASPLIERAARGPTLGRVIAAARGCPNPLLRRWLVVEAVIDGLGTSHFLFPVSLIGFLRALSSALTVAEAARDFIAFVGERRNLTRALKDTDGRTATNDEGLVVVHQTWLDTLVDVWLPEGELWFRANMPLGTQHYALWSHAIRLSEAIGKGRPIPLNDEETGMAKCIAGAVPADIEEGLKRLAPFAEWRS